MTVTNFFQLRWADGYSYVSAAAPDVAVALEQLASVTSGSSDHASLTVNLARIGDRAVPVGLIRLDVTVSSSPRRLHYIHAVVLPARARGMASATWHRIVARRYGDEIEERIRSLYEELAVVTKSDGRARLAPLEITDDDVEAELAASPAKPEAAEAEPETAEAGPAVAPESRPRSSRDRPTGTPPRVVAGLVVALLALGTLVIVLLVRGGPGKSTDGGALAAERTRANAAEARAQEAEAERDLQRAEADKQRRKAENCGLTCDDINEKLVEVQDERDEAKGKLAAVEPKLSRAEARIDELEARNGSLAAAGDSWQRRAELAERSLGVERAALARAERAKAEAEDERDEARRKARSAENDLDALDQHYRAIERIAKTLCRQLNHKYYPACKDLP